MGKAGQDFDQNGPNIVLFFTHFNEQLSLWAVFGRQLKFGEQVLKDYNSLSSSEIP